MKKKHNKKRVSPVSVSLYVLFFIIAIVFLYCTSDDTKEQSDEDEGEKPKTVQKKITIARPSKKLAIVIDDIGYDLDAVERLLDLDIPLTLSVLPYCPYSEAAARRAHQAGREVMLHIPMEPKGHPKKNPGEGALLLTMTHQEIEDALARAMDSVPFIAGANNHMGSLFMEDRENVQTVLAVLKKQDLYFLDSVTTSRSKGKQAALATGIRYGARDIFIDNSHETEDTCTSILNVINERNNWETLIAIGHPYQSTVTALRQMLPDLQKRGIAIVPLSEIMGP